MQFNTAGAADAFIAVICMMMRTCRNISRRRHLVHFAGVEEPVQRAIGRLYRGKDDQDKERVGEPDGPRTGGAEEMDGEGQAEEGEPEVEVEGVGEDAVVRVVVPAAGQGGPDALPQDVHQLGSHFFLFKSSSSLSLPKMHLKKIYKKFAII